MVLAAMLMCRTAAGAGVTIITHGYNGDVTGWITAMAQVMPAYYQGRYPGLATNFADYTMTLTTNTGKYLFTITTNGSAPSATASGEIVIRLDWSQEAGGFSSDGLSTSNVAWAVCQELLLSNAIPQLNGHALAELPVHLMGHSRGGSLMAELCRQLGTNGVWVDHLTTLDPHPLNNDGNNDSPLTIVDAPVRTYANVLYHDDYWQNLSMYFTDPTGEPVAGAYVRQLTQLSGGYINSGFLEDPYQYHSNVHLWYYGTMNLATPANYSDDGEAVSITSTMRSTWWVNYEEQGTNAGLSYSLIGGGNRLSTDRPLGLASDPAIQDGYNQVWDLGTGTTTNNRTALPANNGTWPNVIKFDVTGTNVVTVGGMIGTKLYYQYAGMSNLTMQLYFDSDLNPYNTNSVLAGTLHPVATGAGSVGVYASLGMATTNVGGGVYAVYAKISDGVHSRYLYAPEVVQVVSPQQAPVLDIAAAGGGKYVIGINGVTGQKIALQSSRDLRSWTGLATNTLSAPRWTYTNAPAVNAQFYRAVLSQ